MSDRELLELAAKAAGIESSIGLLPKDGVSIIQPSGDKWNPLTDDGDALRLAVKLKIDVCWNNNEGTWEVNAWPRVGIGSGEDESDDPCAATRLAIVRSAAEIGRTMK